MSVPMPEGNVRPTRREERRAATVAEIKALARRQLATAGTGGLSLRGIAREMRMASAALFRYFDSQADLITALCVDAYNSKADAMESARSKHDSDPAAQWRAVCIAVREWALQHPADYALISGTPLPGYQAQPEQTGPAAARVVAVLGAAYLAAVGAGIADPARTSVHAISAGPLLASMVPGTLNSTPPSSASSRTRGRPSWGSSQRKCSEVCQHWS